MTSYKEVLRGASVGRLRRRQVAGENPAIKKPQSFYTLYNPCFRRGKLVPAKAGITANG